jgi:hypothetical protein
MMANNGEQYTGGEGGIRTHGTFFNISQPMFSLRAPRRQRLPPERFDIRATKGDTSTADAEGDATAVVEPLLAETRWLKPKPLEKPF